MKRPKIQKYSKVQEFFKDWFAFLKHLDPKWSLRTFAKNAQVSVGLASGLQTKNTKLTQQSLNKIIPELKLLPSEESYLRNWISLRQNNQPLNKVNAVKNLTRFKSFKNQNPKEYEAFQYLNHWYHLAIREMSDLPDFQLDPKWIQERLLWKVPLVDISKAMSFLVENKFIEFDQNNKPKSPSRSIDCNGDILSLAITNMHQNLLTRAQTALMTVAPEKRHFEGYTVALNSTDYKKAAEIIQNAIDQIASLVQNSQSTSEVYHLEVALFPLTQKPVKESA